MLARAERLHRQAFRLRSSQRVPAWEPPVDVLETGREVLVIVALPGVSMPGVTGNTVVDVQAHPGEIGRVHHATILPTSRRSAI